MGFFTKLRQKRETDKFTSFPWMPRELGSSLAGLDLNRVRALKEIASRVPPGDSRCQRLFISAFPSLVAEAESSLARIVSGEQDIDRFLDEIITRKAESALPAVRTATAPLTPQGFPVNKSAVLERIKVALLDGWDREDCPQVLHKEMYRDPRAFCRDASGWFDRNFDRAYGLLHKSIDWEKYPGLELDRAMCRERFQEGWDWRRLPVAESRRMREDLNKSPSKFIRDFDEWMALILARFCKGIGKQLAESLPEGCGINYDNCLATAQGIIGQATFDDLPNAFKSLTEQFMTAFTDDALRHVDGLEELYQAQARKVLDSILSSIESQLPFGCTVDIHMCVNELVRLMRTKTKPEDLVKRFVEELARSPRIYLNMPQPSSYESHGGSDQAMLASLPPRRY